MVTPAADSLDRPALGHYQRRLAAVLNRQPLRVPAPQPQPADHPRRLAHAAHPRTRRYGQLALPMELR